MLTVAIDLGTTGVRAILYDEALNALGEHYEEYGLNVISSTAIEQDAELWWQLSCQAVRGAVAKASASPMDVKAVGISSQSMTLVPVDAQFEPLRGAISWLDRRAASELDQVLEKLPAQRIYEITGKLASTVYTLPKLMWLMKHEPQVLDACRFLLLPHDFLLARMTGQAVSEHTMASGTMLYDLSRAGWSEEIVKAFDLPGDKLPPIMRGGEPVGSLLPKAASAMGLTTQTVAYVGGQDQKCASLAAGLKAGVATASLGTASAIEMVGIPSYELRIPAFA